MMISRRFPLTLCLLLALCARAGAGEDGQKNLLENPDFADGEKGWKSVGSVKATELEENGKKVPVLELKLKDKKHTELFQEFDVEPGEKLYVEVVAKASEDFKPIKPNPGPKMETGGYYLWSPQQRTNNDVLIELNDQTHWYYKAGKLKPGGDWVTTRYHFKKLSPRDKRGRDMDERIINFIFPPGEGTVWVKSVRASLEKP